MTRLTLFSSECTAQRTESTPLSTESSLTERARTRTHIVQYRRLSVSERVSVVVWLCGCVIARACVWRGGGVG